MSVEEGQQTISGKVLVTVAGSLLTIGIVALFTLWAQVVGITNRMVTKTEAIQQTREIEAELRTEFREVHRLMNAEINRLRSRHEP